VIVYSKDLMVFLTFTYKNYRGEVSERKICSSRLEYGTTEFHPEPQWFLTAWDYDKQEHRSFALKDMTNVKCFTR